MLSTSRAVAPSLRRNDTLRAWSSRYARLVLDRCQGNKRQACGVLQISYHTLQSYLTFPVHEPAAQETAEEDEGDRTAEAESGV